MSGSEKDYEAPIREYSKFSASVSQLFDSNSINNLVAAVENEPPLSREEHLKQLRIRAGLLLNNETGLRDYPTQSHQQKPQQQQKNLTGSLPALNMQSLPKSGSVFGSFMSKAQNAASGLMKQVNVVAEAAKHAVSEAHAMIIPEEKHQQPQEVLQMPQKEPSIETPGTNLLDLTPPTADNGKEVLPSSELINEEERRLAQKTWGYASSNGQEYGDYSDDDDANSFDQDDSFIEEEEEEEDRSQWTQPEVQQKPNPPTAAGMDDEAWLRSHDKEERAAIRARDGMLMAAVTGIHDPMVNGQAYYEDEDEEEEDSQSYRSNRNVELNYDDGVDDIRSHIQRSKLILSMLQL